MDFVTSLPQTADGKDTVVVFVDKLTKMCHLFPTTAKGLDARKVAHVFLDQVFRHHGIPENIISDRDVRFTHDFWHEVLLRLGSFCNLSTAYHP